MKVCSGPMKSFLSWSHDCHLFPFPASEFRALLVIWFFYNGTPGVLKDCSLKIFQVTSAGNTLLMENLVNCADRSPHSLSRKANSPYCITLEIGGRPQISSPRNKPLACWSHSGHMLLWLFAYRSCFFCWTWLFLIFWRQNIVLGRVKKWS